MGGPVPKHAIVSAAAKVSKTRAWEVPTTTKRMEERQAPQKRRETAAKVGTRARVGLGIRANTNVKKIPPMLLEAIGDTMKTPHDLCHYLKLVEDMIAKGWKSYTEIKSVVLEHTGNKKGVFHHSMPMNWRKMLCVFLFGNGQGGMPKGRGSGKPSHRNGGEGPSQDVGHKGVGGVPPQDMALPRRLYTTLTGAPEINDFCDDWGNHNSQRFDRNTSMVLIAEYESRYGVVSLD